VTRLYKYVMYACMFTLISHR